MDVPSSLTSDDEVLEILEREYCEPAGCPLDFFLNSLKTPPLTTILRFNQCSSVTGEERLYNEEEEERIIREGLQLANQNRFCGRSLQIRPVSGVLDTWICELGSSDAEGNSRFEKKSEDFAKRESKVIVDLSAGEALLRGSNLYAPGVLTCSPNMRSGERVSVFCDVQRKCLRGRVAEFKEELYYVGSGVAQLSRGQLFSDQVPPMGMAVCMDQPRYPLISLNEFLCDHPMISSQNLPSCVTVQVLSPKPEETILDCCAAPGGKTLHMASLMAATGRLIALDKSVERARKLAEVTANFKNVQVFCADVLKIGQIPDLPRQFDRVLVDAPCSASGQRPRLSLHSLHTKQLDACPKIQKGILHSVIPLLKPGGKLVYSTCSVLTRENEDIVAWVLRQHPELRLCQQSPRLGGLGFPVPGLTNQQSDLLQRFSMLPSAEGDTIGFFIALFEKTY